MNVLFFLIPKSEVEYLFSDDTIRQALEKMDYHNYSVIPVLTAEGDYAYSLSDGDLLRFIKKHDVSMKDCENYSISMVKRSRELKSINIFAEREELMPLLVDQNFVPVVDDRNKFIGIVTRRQILTKLKDHLLKEMK